MTPFEYLKDATAASQQRFLSTPILQRALQGHVDRAEYIAFLGQAYHHVKHTVPLLMACGARLPSDKEWLREAMAEYIEEEIGHQRWILDDIRALGGDTATVIAAPPMAPTDLMVRYVRDVITYDNPVGFLGMVHVLEGTSTAMATHAAQAIRETQGLPKGAFRYLESHGSLDLEHVAFFETLVNRLEAPEDMSWMIQVADRVYDLYGQMFNAVEASVGSTQA